MVLRPWPPNGVIDDSDSAFMSSISSASERLEREAIESLELPESANRLAVVFYATDDTYAISSLVFVHLLRELGIRSDADVVILHLPLSPPISELMTKSGAITELVEPLHPLADPYFRDCLVKLRIFQLIQYERVLFVDADAIPLKSLDDLLSLPLDRPLAAPRAYWLTQPRWTSAMLLARPSLSTWACVLRHIRRTCLETNLDGYFDMEILNNEFVDEIGTLPSTALRLNSEWELKSRPNYFPDPIQAYSDTSVVHFSALGKPWMYSPDDVRRLRPNAYAAFYDSWERWHAAHTAVLDGWSQPRVPKRDVSSLPGRGSAGVRRDRDPVLDSGHLAATALSHGAMQKPDELAALIELLAGRKLTSVVEIGTALGGTLFLWCRLAHPEATIVSIDLPGGPFGSPDGTAQPSVLASFAESTQSVHLLRLDSRDPATRAELDTLLGGQPIDLLFIDGDHTYRGVRADFLEYAPRVRDGGLVVFHDILPTETHPEVEVHRLWRKLQEIDADHCQEVIRIDPERPWGGFGVLTWRARPGSIGLEFSDEGDNTENSDGSSFLEPVDDVDTVIGPLLLSRGDQVINAVLRSDRIWEPLETAFLRSRLHPGDTFVDVGAHVGYFTILGARCVGPTGTVIALEPEDRNLDLLRRNLVRNGCTNTRVLPFAAHASKGWMSLALDEVNRGAHYLVPAGETKTIVRCLRLDDELPEKVDVVKIDAQGYDHDVVTGLLRTVANNPRITILCEFSPTELDRRRLALRTVLSGYESIGLTMSMFDERGRLHPMPADAIEFVCRTRGRPDLSLVLERSADPTADIWHTNHTPRKSDDIEINKASDGCVVFQTAEGRVHYLSHTAAIVFELCTGENSLSEIVQTIQDNFGLAESFNAAIEDCLGQLRAEGLIV